MNRRKLGAGVVSALLTILLLVAGFAAAAGMLSAVVFSQAEVMKKAVDVGEAVAERLQAFVYEDVRTNRTLLTIRNVGSTGSEVEYMLAVGHDGSVLREVRLNETLRLGVQQAATAPLADILGPEFDNYTEVRSRMATLYLKTVKGGVFGSGYMAPPSVMTAAYATSTTTVTTEETSTNTLPVETGTWTVTSWTATVIIDNPDHWPVESYVGVAFAHTFKPAQFAQSTGFPSWGLHPGLQATIKRPWDGAEVVANVTSADDVRIPKYVACWRYGGGYVPGPAGVLSWGGYSPAYRFSELGPTYVQVKYLGSYYGKSVCREWDGPDDGELFEPRGTTRRYGVAYVAPPATTVSFTRSLWGVTTLYTNFWTSAMGPTTATITSARIVSFPPHYPLDFNEEVRYTYTRTYVTTATIVTRVGTEITYTPTTITWVTTIRGTARLAGGSVTYRASTQVTATTSTTLRLWGTATKTMTWTMRLPGTTVATLTIDRLDTQEVSFPVEIAARFTWCVEYYYCTWYFIENVFRLAYIKAVNLWNTTEVLAFLDASQTASRTLTFKADRPIGLAAVYVYDRTVARLPPPPRPPIEGTPGCINRAFICPTYGYGTDIQKTSSSITAGPCDTIGNTVTVTFKCTNPNDGNCGAWIAPGPGSYSEDELQKCPKAPDGTFTCTVPAGSTIIAGKAVPKPQPSG